MKYGQGRVTLLSKIIKFTFFCFQTLDYWQSQCPTEILFEPFSENPSVAKQLSFSFSPNLRCHRDSLGEDCPALRCQSCFSSRHVRQQEHWKHLKPGGWFPGIESQWYCWYRSCWPACLTWGLIRSWTAWVDPLRDWGWLLVSSGISSSPDSPESRNEKCYLQHLLFKSNRLLMMFSL